MSIQRIVVCEAQVPFVRGGAEYLARSLVTALRERGYETELVSLPFKWYPKEELLAHAAAWHLIDLSESNGRSIDLVIPTKFPTYFVRHPRKVVWLLHQYRAAYELAGTLYSEFTHVERDVGLRDTLLRLDCETLGECRHLFTISKTVASRLDKFNGVLGEPLYPPSPFTGRLTSGPYGDYVLAVGRLESVKRPDLAVRAMQYVDSPTRLIVAGEGTKRRETEGLAESLGLLPRIEFLGAVDEEVLLNLYSKALGIVYTPFDEDYGYVTLEAFLSRKPVVTTRDAGGPLEFVEDGINGFICEPTSESIARAVNTLAANRKLAADYGQAGYERVCSITWDAVVEKLLQ